MAIIFTTSPTITLFSLFYFVSILFFIRLMKSNSFSIKNFAVEIHPLPDKIKTLFILFLIFYPIPFTISSISGFIAHFLKIEATPNHFVLVVTPLTVLSLIVLLKVATPCAYHHIMGKNYKAAISQGIMWAISLTWIFFSLNVFLRIILFSVTKTVPPQQEALLVLEQQKNNPLIFILLSGLIAVIVPIYEEFIFRGLIQNFLYSIVKPNMAILITSLFFAISHYFQAQGLSNIAIILTIFCLSIFLGRIYFKERSILAPIALHVTYNTIMVVITSMATKSF